LELVEPASKTKKHWLFVKSLPNKQKDERKNVLVADVNTEVVVQSSGAMVLRSLVKCLKSKVASNKYSFYDLNYHKSTKCNYKVFRSL
jgi:hypothetical protein